jgi:hypothetical protein
MNFLPEKKYGVPSDNFVKKMFCAKKVTKLPDLTVQNTVDWRWPLFCVHSVIMVFSAQLAEGGGLGVHAHCPPPFPPSISSPARLSRYIYLYTLPCRPSPLLSASSQEKKIHVSCF